MQLSTILGVIVGVGAVLGAMYFKHIAYDVFLNPAAIIVILVGTVATILNSFTGKELSKVGSLFKILFVSGKKGGEIKIINEIVALSEDARKEGILTLEKKIESVKDPFMKKGIRMLVDGVTPEDLEESLTMEIDAMRERHNSNASIFTSAGTYAPTLGVLGAVFGLIAAMSHIEDTEAMAEAIAAAFMATILGIFTGYVLWNPFATKLKTMSKNEAFEKSLVVIGLIAIQKGDPPIRVKEKLLSQFPAKQQQELEKS